ncbi:unnamed protein product [Lathyrus oleraceus]
MAASLQAAATLMQPTKLRSNTLQLKSNQSVSKAFGLEHYGAKVTCSLQSDFKELAHKCVEASKIAGFALATSALVVSGASAEGAPKRLTVAEIQGKTYLEVKGTGTANHIQAKQPMERTSSIPANNEQFITNMRTQFKNLTNSISIL